MKPKIFSLCMVTLLIVACNIPGFGASTPPVETAIAVATNTLDTGGVVTLNNVSFTLALGVANDAQSEMVSAVTDNNAYPWWEIAPAHIQFKLTGYQLQGKFHEPQILVYPTDEFAQLSPVAAEQIQRLRNILAGSALSKDAMPSVPYFNAGPIFASNMQLIDFQSGGGVRMLTQYDQYPAPVNNHELFYHFQGLTNDGKYFVIAILPVSSSLLAEDDKPESPVPPEGVSLPAAGADEQYYEAVTRALNGMYPDSFNPSLFQLDTLIQSITVMP